MLFPRSFSKLETVLHLLVYATGILGALAGNHYCHEHRADEIEIAKRPATGETFIATAEFESSVPPEICQWVISCAGLTDPPGQLALRGVQTDRKAGSVRYQLHGKDYDVPPGLMHGVTLHNDSCRIPVAYHRSSQQPRDFIPARLSAVLLHPEHDCARGFLTFHNSCYAVSSATENFTKALQSIRGTAQLASFDRDSEISELVAANAEIPLHWRPLSLTEPVRLGLFYRPADGAVFSLAFNLTGCWLQRAPKLTNFLWAVET